MPVNDTMYVTAKFHKNIPSRLSCWDRLASSAIRLNSRYDKICPFCDSPKIFRCNCPLQVLLGWINLLVQVHYTISLCHIAKLCESELNSGGPWPSGGHITRRDSGHAVWAALQICISNDSQASSLVRWHTAATYHRSLASPPRQQICIEPQRMRNQSSDS